MFSLNNSKCEASIKVIADIMSNDDPSEFEKIMNMFLSMGIHKVKELAISNLTEIFPQLENYGLFNRLCNAMEIFDKHCDIQLQLAKLEYDQKNFLRAQEICKELLVNRPFDVTNLVLLAASCFMCEQYDEALTYLLKAKDINPTCAEVLNNIGSIFCKKSQPEEALPFYFQAINKKHNFIDGWINYCEGLVNTNDKEKAVRAYLSILTYKPDLYKVRNNYGILLMSMNKLEESEYQYLITLKHAPDFPDAWNNLGVLYDKIGNTDKAIDCYENALKLNFNVNTTKINLGRAYFKLKKYEKGIDLFQEVFQLCPGNISAVRHLASIYTDQGKITLAIEVYKKFLEVHPDNLEINIQLGKKYFFDEENYQEAKKYFVKSYDLNPSNKNACKFLSKVYQTLDESKLASEISVQLGDICLEENNLEGAKSAYLWATHLDPENSGGHWKLGLTCYIMGHLDHAEFRYRKAIELKPNFPDAYSDLAIVYEKNGLSSKAIEYYNMALQLQPTHLNALHNLVLMKEKAGQLEDTITLYYRILECDDSVAFDVHKNLANIFYTKKRDLNLALKHYREAINIDNKNEHVFINLGNVLLELKRSDEALICFNEVLKLNEKSVIAYTNIGSIHKDNDNFLEAINAYRMALKIETDFPDAYCNLVQCLQHICDWSDYKQHVMKMREIVLKQLECNTVPSLLPHHSLLYLFPSVTLKKIARLHGEQCFNKINVGEKRQDYVYQTSLSPKGCIRIGYVSSDFGDHPTSQLMQSIPKFHNRKKVEVFCYSLSPNDGSPSWSKIAAESDYFRDVSSLSIIDAANQINSDGIHILVNMNGYTKGARNEIFALRPAPIQVLWLGYPGTSGVSFIDYLITDKVCSPPEYQDDYSEKLAYMKQSVFIGDHNQTFKDLIQRTVKPSLTIRNNLPYMRGIRSTCSMNSSYEMNSYHFESGCTYSNKLQNSNVNSFSRSHYGLPDNGVVYCYFGQLYKIVPSTLDMWIQILKNVPNSVLWLLGFPDIGAANIHSYAVKYKFDASRIIFGQVAPKDEYMKKMQLADVFLDTPLCNGHTTCLDALWSGTPVVTLLGKTFASRVAASQLTTLGCTSLITRSQNEYIKIASKLGLDTTCLETCRSNIWKLRTQSKLFDCKSYTEDLENVYSNIWNKFLSEQSTELVNASYN